MVSSLSQCFVPECCAAAGMPRLTAQMPRRRPHDSMPQDQDSPARESTAASAPPCLLLAVAVKVLLKGEAVAQGQLELPAEMMRALEEESLVMSRIRWAW